VYEQLLIIDNAVVVVLVAINRETQGPERMKFSHKFFCTGFIANSCGVCRTDAQNEAERANTMRITTTKATKSWLPPTHLK
jgi:hypothetical protein